MGAREVTIPYTPRSERHWTIHEALEGKRFGVVVCHRRFGKTVLAINHLLRAAVQCDKQRPRFAYVAPTLKQGKTIAWDYLKHYARAIPGVEFNEAELRCDLPNGGQVRIFGSDNPDALRGTYFDGVVLDEFGLMQMRAWSEVLRPALSDRLGWALFIGTPNGRNAFWDMRNLAERDGAWFLIEHKASETGIIGVDELASARAAMTPDEFDQEYECSFEASVRGAIFASELAAVRESGRIRELVIDPVLPVHTGWDLGVGDATAIWFAQQAHSEIRVVDYYEASGEGMPHYAAVLQRKPYAYGVHYAPHDIEVRELGSGRSRREVARQLGVNFTLAPRVSLEDGIHAARMLLPRCYFDASRCREGLDSLQNYRWEHNSRLDEFKSTPVHDWASHGADAFRYLALALMAEPEKKKAKQRDRSFWAGGDGAWMN